MENRTKRILTIIFGVGAPLFAFWLMQLAMGFGFWNYSFKLQLANYVVIGLIFYILYVITNSVRISAVSVEAVGLIWGIANAFIIQFRGTPVLPWDFAALGTAMAVAGNYKFIPSVTMILAIILFIALVIAQKHFCIKGQFKLNKRNACYRAVALVCASLCVHAAISPEFLEKCGVSADVWDQAASYQQTGAAASFALNTKFLKVEVPASYSETHVEEIKGNSSVCSTVNQNDSSEQTAADKVSVENTERETVTQSVQTKATNIIAIMNESWADFEDYGNLELSESVMDYIHSLDNTIFGHAYTSVFGAGTSASEFEFLTGNSMAFLPSGSIPYQQYVTTPKDSLASLLHGQGYQCFAMHPGERTSWQRNESYPLLGFDQFTCGEDMHVELSDEHGYVGDDSSFNEIIYEYEHRDTSKPFFMFNVTIQNHGSYTDENYETEVYLKDEPGKYPQAEQYLTLANKTDQDFKILVDYFSKCEEPTIILMFGDHQPSVETEFLEKAYGVSLDSMTMEQYMGKFKVPFVIWANYELPDDTIDITSLNFLKQYLLNYAGVEKSNYDYYLEEISKEMPAMTFVGYFDNEGNAYSHLQQTEFDSIINDYSVVQYDMLFGDAKFQKNAE